MLADIIRVKDTTISINQRWIRQANPILLSWSAILVMSLPREQSVGIITQIAL